jgi:GTP diphosphokinase / guanosine-3',5'-bis(diphosphate) 3'-diphosphatase
VIGRGPKNLLLRAKRFALQHHAGQRRPNASQEPFVLHLAEVAGYVADEGWPEVVVAAAWLHDVVEDTPVTVAELRSAFGDDVAEVVAGLTDPEGHAGLPLHERKRRQARRLGGLPEEVKVVKLADQVSNVRSVVDDPPLDWEGTKCLAYLAGAAEVAAACGGVAPRLLALLALHHARGMAKYLGATADGAGPGSG